MRWPKIFFWVLIIQFLINWIISGRKLSTIPDIFISQSTLWVALFLFTIFKVFGNTKDVAIIKVFFYKEICKPCLENHNYHNVTFENYSSIPDIRIGLMAGDDIKESNICIVCDEFKYSEIKYYHEITYYDKEGKSTTERKQTFSGTEIFYPCSVNVEAPVRIVPTYMKNGKENPLHIMCKEKKEDEEHIDIEDIEFNESFEVFSRDPHSAFYFLSADKIELLKQLRKTCAMSLVVEKEGIYSAMNITNNLFTWSSNAIPVEQMTPDTYNGDVEKIEQILNKLIILSK